MVVVLFAISNQRGNVRTGVDVGTNERNMGALPLGVFQLLKGPPTFTCSQLYVNGSPSGSVADPVRVNAVLMGMVKLEPAFTTGALLPVLINVPQVEPPPERLKVVIRS